MKASIVLPIRDTSKQQLISVHLEVIVQSMGIPDRSLFEYDDDIGQSATTFEKEEAILNFC